ncbi:30S ribosomal protein S15 [Bienertia sinuspersici]
MKAGGTSFGAWLGVFGYTGTSGRLRERRSITNEQLAINSPPNKSATKWKPPEESIYKINTDAALFEDGKSVLGMILRDHMGDVFLVNSLAARHAIKIAIGAGFQKVVLESDCIKLVNYLKEGKDEHDAFRAVARDVLILAANVKSIRYSFVRRTCNKAPHELAHSSRNFGEMRV